MSDTPHTNLRSSKTEEWLLSSKQRARQLRSIVHQEAAHLFHSGDLTDFLALLSRLHYYDVHNLLLIYRQYPQATYLAGGAFWKKLAGTASAPIKPECKDSGIELLLPFTEVFGSDQFGLTWFSGTQYDISQTTVTEPPSSPDPYFSGKKHTHQLISCIQETIATRYHRSVIPTSSSKQLRSAGLPGQMNDYTILLRKDIPSAHRLLFLSECLTQLVLAPSFPITAPQKDLVIQYILHCLFQIWNISSPRKLHQPSVVLNGILPDRQLPFLTLIRDTVRFLDEEISSLYREQSREEDETEISPYLPEENNEQ